MKSFAPLIAVLWLVAAGAAQAQQKDVADFGDKEFTKGDVMRALTPAPRTRGLSIGKEEATEAPAAAGAAAAAPAASGAPAPAAQAPATAPAAQAAAAAPAAPVPAPAATGAKAPAAAGGGARKLSMQLQFALNSAELTPGARRRLDAIGEALASPELSASKFVISGHTDSTGGYDYNLRLSKRRADSVKLYLVSAHDLAPQRLKSVGRGPDELIDEDDPKNPANRRVQLTLVD